MNKYIVVNETEDWRELATKAELLEPIARPIWGNAINELLGCIVDPDGTNSVPVITNQGVIRCALQHIYELRSMLGLDQPR